ncbi:MAG: hypothetical protein QM662_16460 [Gordonia sp. (in: high G+C Gram-positive bacteria)]
MGSDERRVLIQAHNLRSAALRAAVVHGDRTPRTESRYLRCLIISVVLAFAIIAGILLGGVVADLLSGARW